jgi:bifunctional non-homologous end joining protein LigD
MTKALRTGKVLIDWSQNNGSKTTVAPYSLRARQSPTVSTPVSWDEVRACRRPEELFFTADVVLDRVAKHGDLFAPLLRLPFADQQQRVRRPVAGAVRAGLGQRACWASSSSTGVAGPACRARRLRTC